MTMQPGGVWTYRPGVQAGSHVVGYSVETIDGRIGKIDAASDEADAAHLVVDTGFWIFGKKRLIPAGMVTRVDHANQKVYMAMTKDQIKQAPDYDEAMTAHDDAYYDKYSSYYSPYSS
jgi:hypothetical protein